ncbi:MAG: biotin transporter BioY [Clostridia bacterium]|nr:biotin transporter BioY [Clostridia bacterium]
MTFNLAMIAVFTAIMCICSWISIPVFGVPVSLQTFAVFMSASILGAKHSAVSILIYATLGIIGVPVFSGFKSGAAVIAGPTGGYLIGFFFAAICIGMLLKYLPQKKWVVWVSMFSGQIICYIFGVLWYKFVYLDAVTSIKEVLLVCVVPFLIPDIIKTVAAIILSQSVKRILNKSKY